MVWFPRPVDLVNKSVSLAGLEVSRDISYGAAKRDKIDIYRPRDAARLPVIVFFYGGSWQFGHRAEYGFAAAVLAKNGFVVAVPDYRLYPQVKFPEFLSDCAAATAFIIENIADYGGDPGQVYVMGHSAGAYNAVMLALAPQFLAAQGVSTSAIAGVIGLSGPYDFLPLRDPIIKDIFSPPEDIKATQPITYARAGAPPLFLLHGGADVTVLPRNTTALAARLRQAGGRVEARIYPKIGHIGMITACLPYLAWRARVLRDVLDFIAACREQELIPDGSGMAAAVLG
jgi:acetyl esterase/lipase